MEHSKAANEATLTGDLFSPKDCSAFGWNRQSESGQNFALFVKRLYLA